MKTKHFRPQANHENERLVHRAIEALCVENQAEIRRLGLVGYQLSYTEEGTQELARRLKVSLRDVNLALRSGRKSVAQGGVLRIISSSRVD